MKFEWNRSKAISNLRNHDVSFNEAATVFADPLSELYGDPDHSRNENRMLLIGHSNRGSLLFVSFLDRGNNRIRIISARHVTRSERKQYEETER
jgi:uncharacterized DUF497 family protein